MNTKSLSTIPVQLKDSAYFVGKLVRMREGMLKHRNEDSTIKNLVGILKNCLVKKMRQPRTSPEVLDRFAEFFVHDSSDDARFARECLKSAIGEMDFAGKDDFLFCGFMTDAVRQSSLKGHLDIKDFLAEFTPNGWEPLKRREAA